MKMTKILSAGLVVLGVLAFQFAVGGLQDFSKHEYLKEPRIRKMPRQKMLVVEAKGDPNVVGKEVFSLLFRTFFSLKGVKMYPSRARWLNMASAPKEEWVGLYGLPLPDSISSLPSSAAGVRIEDWEYGEVAEILHVGPYSEEAPTIKRLHEFIQEMGYQIAGPHEEEYLKGPGMASGPAEYLTIIRYQVRKKQH